jgi:REP element-mobilizing transposase RayT
LKTPIIRPYVELDEFAIMPSHLHGIVIIKDVLEIQDVSESGGEMKTGAAQLCARTEKDAAFSRIDYRRV